MNGFGEAFLDDYFAECEDHLTSIRQALLRLDASVGLPRPDSQVVEELFRAYHSLKGLSGMVEDRHGESLAHEMESYLRAIRDGDASLTTQGVETLIDGTGSLEQAIAAQRRRQPPPDSSETLQALRSLVAGAGGADGPQPPTVAGAAMTECVFTPSAALSARGHRGVGR
jgi:two-component system chemotaxis sensor kinase CheA